MSTMFGTELSMHKSQTRRQESESVVLNTVSWCWLFRSHGRWEISLGVETTTTTKRNTRKVEIKQMRSDLPPWKSKMKKQNILDNLRGVQHSSQCTKWKKWKTKNDRKLCGPGHLTLLPSFAAIRTLHVGPEDVAQLPNHLSTSGNLGNRCF